MSFNQPVVVHFLITQTPNNVTFQQTDGNQLYNVKRPSGFVRKAIAQRIQNPNQTNQLGRFTDT